jgi:hypothetical protein
MQQWQVNFQAIFAPGFWSKWMVPEKWFTHWGFEPLSTQSWVFCLNHKTTATRQILAQSLFLYNSYPFWKIGDLAGCCRQVAVVQRWSSTQVWLYSLLQKQNFCKVSKR